MTKDRLEELAALIRDGKATDEQKLELLRALNGELKEVSSILKTAKQQKGA
jgi:hypothetical protein